MSSDNSNYSKRKRRWLSFSLRSFLVFVIGFGIWLSWYVNRVDRQRRAVEWVEQQGGRVGYRFECVQNGVLFTPPERRDWIREIFGVNTFSTVVRVDLSHADIDELSVVELFGDLRWIDISHTKVEDVGPLKRLHKLEYLSFHHSEVEDLTPISNLKNLRKITLWDTELSDIGPLADLPNLESVDLEGTWVSDVSPLIKLSNLRYVNLTDTYVSDSELEKMKKALPDCHVLTLD